MKDIPLRYIFAGFLFLLTLYCLLNAMELEPHLGGASSLRNLFKLVGMD